MMVKGSADPVGHILAQAFCGLEEAAEGTVCQCSALDITVTQACR